MDVGTGVAIALGLLLMTSSYGGSPTPTGSGQLVAIPGTQSNYRSSSYGIGYPHKTYQYVTSDTLVNFISKFNKKIPDYEVKLM
jgi:hypothetical protein